MLLLQLRLQHQLAVVPLQLHPWPGLVPAHRCLQQLHEFLLRLLRVRQQVSLVL
jgi:hypothetical protein